MIKNNVAVECPQRMSHSKVTMHEISNTARHTYSLFIFEDPSKINQLQINFACNFLK